MQSFKVSNSGRKTALIVVDVHPPFVEIGESTLLGRIDMRIRTAEYGCLVECFGYAEAGGMWDRQQGLTIPRPDMQRDSLIPSLHDHPHVTVFKQTRSAWKGDQDLHVIFRRSGIEDVHIVGVETHDCVLATAYEAFDLGYEVTVIEECCAAPSQPEMHDRGIAILRAANMTNHSRPEQARSIAL